MSVEIPAMYVGAASGAGAVRRALVDHIGYLNPVSGLFVTPKTAAYTVTNQEFGCVFSNTGASGSVTFTLPTPEPNAILVFLKTVTGQNVVLSGTFTGGTTLTNATAALGGIILIGLDNTSWHPLATSGVAAWTLA